MATIKRIEDLEIWQIARELCRFIKTITTKGPLVRDFELKDQIRRSSGSGMDNIAEGFGRGGNREFIQFLEIANGSVCEVKSQLYRAFDYEYISKEEFDNGYELADKLSRKTIIFINYLINSEMKGPKFNR